MEFVDVQSQFLDKSYLMTEPLSTKNEPFCDFTKQAYSIFTDDFCHEKFFVAKPTAKTNRSIVKLKETVTQQKSGGFGIAEQLKLWFNLPKAGTLYAKLKSNDYVKLHYDDGIREFQGKKIYLYTGLTSNKSLNLTSVRFGVGHDSQHCHTDNRFKINVENGQHKYYFYNRTMVYHNKLRFGLVTCFDLCNKVLQKNNVLFGYDIDNRTKVFFRATNNGFRKQNEKLGNPQAFFDNLTFDVLRDFSDNASTTLTSGGLEVGYDLKKKDLNNVQAVVQVVKGKQLAKLGLNRYLDVNLVVKQPLSWFDNLAVLSAGVSITGLTKKQFAVKNGFQLAVNL